MSSRMLINFNLGEYLSSQVDKKKDAFYIEVILDGDLIGRIVGYLMGSEEFLVSNGVHSLHCILHHLEKFDNSDVTYDLGFKQFEADNDDTVFTINVYFLSRENMEFGEGNIEFVPERGKSKGCYVATCVYGSYDCPQVWTLRRYRDNTLASTWYGRAFVHTYYAISPTLVKWFGETKWFKKIWKGKLDKMVCKLQEKGVESTPYKDIDW